MKKITAREEDIMNIFWHRGSLFVKQVVEELPEPKPHYNTISTMVRSLAGKGYLGHEVFGNTHQYFPLVSKADYRQGNLRGIIKKYFGNSTKRVVSTLVEEEQISVDELKEIIRKIEEKRKTGK